MRRALGGRGERRPNIAQIHGGAKHGLGVNVVARARHDVPSEYKVLGRASGAGDTDGGTSPHARGTPRCEIQARLREITGDHRNVL